MSKGSSGDTSDSQPNQSDSETDNRSDAPSSGGELSEVERLFAGITPSPGPSSSSHPTPQRSNAAIDSLFANVSSPANIPPSPSPTTSTGPQLLNAMFAFARSTAPQQTPAIHSPQPSTSPPQVLTQDVLSNLLGLPPSRTASAASGYTSAVSHPSSREGDNEDDSSSDSPSTIFHPDDLEFGQRIRNGNLARMTGTEFFKDFGLNVPHRLGTQTKINGDVTPRGPLNATVRGNNIPSASASSTSAKPRANRELQRFESDSELWPYTRGPIEDNSPTDVGGEDNEIVELDFEETSVLSDPAAFDQALRNRKSAVNLRVHNGVGSSALPNGNYSPSGSVKKIGRKSRKERDAKAREEIERSWDIPPPSPASTSGTSSRETDILFGPPASPSPCPSPEFPPHGPPAPEMKTPTMTARATLASLNGNGISPHNNSNSKGKGKMAVNGHAKKLNGHVNGVDAKVVNESLITTIETQPHPVAKMARNDFVKEVLTLIHTDKAFVDTLWQDYMARLE
ncbi:hypothetical protein M413DRAFT_132496 [Hebeloma cylindrosporum]|uniref:Uncharacterized protein n=1 Tax=Hebeloma cylindrosporum TaxID=76867 RepID=A0A0C3C0F7_HEBCY|nr:hypothetical protein M413DRAFT_132496 [Hebeloma cylindrosporum h7]